MTFSPIHQTEKKDKRGPAGGTQHRGPLRSGRGPPALLSPRQLAAEPGPPLSPGSSRSSAPSPAGGGEAASNLPGRAKGERGGAGREATASPALERTKFPFRALRGATLGSRSRLRDAALNDSTGCIGCQAG